MPQFIEPESAAKVLAFPALGGTFVAIGTVWSLVLAAASGPVRSFFRDRPRADLALSKIAGAAFIGLGLRLAVSRQ